MRVGRETVVEQHKTAFTGAQVNFNPLLPDINDSPYVRHSVALDADSGIPGQHRHRTFPKYAGPTCSACGQFQYIAFWCSQVSVIIPNECGVFFMIIKRLVLLIVGLITLIIGCTSAIISVIAAAKELPNDLELFIVPLVISLIMLVVSIMCFSTRKRLLYTHYKKLYSEVEYVIISHVDSDFTAVSVPVDFYSVTTGRSKSILNMIIHFTNGKVITRRVKPKSIEYQCLAPYIES
jgi:predicted RNase H-related nuclease YkuK (DUF458 family)